MRKGTAVLFCILASLAARAAADPDTMVSSAPSVTLPQDGDNYSRLLAQAASRDAATDFRALRFAWLDSKARERHSEISLQPGMHMMQQAADAGNHKAVRERAVALLSEEYVSILGQMYL